jgi:glycosyltransferase involved in cell wall biosynthesis
MRIVTIINGLNNGGAEKFAVELCNRLSEEHEVFLLVKTPLSHLMLPPKKLKSSVQLIEFNSQSKWDVVFFFKLLFAVFKLRPNIIHLHSSILVFYTCFYPLVFRTTKVIHTIHNQVTPAYLKAIKWAARFKKLGCNFQHVVISNQIGRAFKELFPMLSFHTIENGVEPLSFAEDLPTIKKDNRIHLVAIGHFGVAKRFDLLADVLQMQEIAPYFKLQIVGEEKDVRKPVTQYIKSLNAENVELVGLKSNTGDYLKHADALVIWSSFEGMPLVMLESLSLSCPVISSPVGGIPDVIESGQCGILTQGIDQLHLKEALLRFKEMTQEEIDSMRQRCLESFEEKYSMSICVKKYNAFFEGKA